MRDCLKLPPVSPPFLTAARILSEAAWPLWLSLTLSAIFRASSWPPSTILPRLFPPSALSSGLRILPSCIAAVILLILSVRSVSGLIPIKLIAALIALASLPLPILGRFSLFSRNRATALCKWPYWPRVISSTFFSSFSPPPRLSLVACSLAALKALSSPLGPSRPSSVWVPPSAPSPLLVHPGRESPRPLLAASFPSSIAVSILRIPSARPSSLNSCAFISPLVQSVFPKADLNALEKVSGGGLPSRTASTAACTSANLLAEIVFGFCSLGPSSLPSSRPLRNPLTLSRKPGFGAVSSLGRPSALP